MRRLILAVLLVALLPASLFAQSQATTGVIEGVITDATGASLPGVTVTLRNIETNYTYTMVTDSGGTRAHVYSYDDIYQITEVNYPAGFDYLATDTTFNYDAAGTVDYQYDASGNMTYDERFLYSYDPENRLVQVKKSGQCHRYYYRISQVP